MWLQVVPTSLTLQSLVMSWASPHGRATLQPVLQTFTFFSSSRVSQQYNSSDCRVDGGRRAATRHQGNDENTHLFQRFLHSQRSRSNYMLWDWRVKENLCKNVFLKQLLPHDHLQVLLESFIHLITTLLWGKAGFVTGKENVRLGSSLHFRQQTRIFQRLP